MVAAVARLGGGARRVCVGTVGTKPVDEKENILGMALSNRCVLDIHMKTLVQKHNKSGDMVVVSSFVVLTLVLTHCFVSLFIVLVKTTRAELK